MRKSVVLGVFVLVHIYMVHSLKNFGATIDNTWRIDAGLDITFN